MEINVKSLKFNADQKLLDFVQKKVTRLSKFFEGMDTVDVTLSLSKEPDNKNVKLQTRVLGQDLVITRNAKTFEDAVTAAVDAMKESIVRSKEKVIEK
jgi:putative sigma-54 modulation protein